MVLTVFCSLTSLLLDRGNADFHCPGSYQESMVTSLQFRKPVSMWHQHFVFGTWSVAQRQCVSPLLWLMGKHTLLGIVVTSWGDEQMPWERYFTSYEETMCFSHRERLGTNILQPLLSHRCDQTSREKPLGGTRVYLTHSFNSPPRKARSRRLVNPIALAGRKQRADRKSSTPPARL